MNRKSNALDLHVPAPRARPGDEPDFSGWTFPEPGETPRPDIDESADDHQAVFALDAGVCRNTNRAPADQPIADQIERARQGFDLSE